MCWGLPHLPSPTLTYSHALKRTRMIWTPKLEESRQRTKTTHLRLADRARWMEELSGGSGERVNRTPELNAASLTANVLWQRILCLHFQAPERMEGRDKSIEETREEWKSPNGRLELGKVSLKNKDSNTWRPKIMKMAETIQVDDWHCEFFLCLWLLNKRLTHKC